MITIKKRYKIKFASAGYLQYASFSEKENGELHLPSLFVSYSKAGEKPVVEGAKTIDEVLEIMKASPIIRNVELHLINGSPVSFYSNTKAKKEIATFKSKFDKLIESESSKFFEKILEPIMRENKWFVSSSHIGMLVLIEKDEDGEWDNISRNSKQFDFDYLCAKFMSSFRKVDITLDGEQGNHIYDGFSSFANYIDYDYLVEKGLVINSEDI